MFILNPFTGQFDFVGGASGATVTGALLVGVINGVNLVFTSPTSFQGGTLRLHYNGVRVYEPDDYAASESGGPGTGFDTVTFVAGFAPKAGDRLLADYVQFV